MPLALYRGPALKSLSLRRKLDCMAGDVSHYLSMQEEGLILISCAWSAGCGMPFAVDTQFAAVLSACPEVLAVDVASDAVATVQQPDFGMLHGHTSLSCILSTLVILCTCCLDPKWLR